MLKRIQDMWNKTGTPSAKPGQAAEALALQHLQHAGLKLVCRNYQAMGKSTGKQLGEIDLIMRTPEGGLVFVEVRARSSASFGGAAASITKAKQARLVKAATHYLGTLSHTPPCRFDVVAIDSVDKNAPRIDWIEHAFDAA
jgi:putative endonuclease